MIIHHLIYNWYIFIWHQRHQTVLLYLFTNNLILKPDSWKGMNKWSCNGLLCSSIANVVVYDSQREKAFMVHTQTFSSNYCIPRTFFASIYKILDLNSNLLVSTPCSSILCQLGIQGIPHACLWVTGYCYRCLLSLVP